LAPKVLPVAQSLPHRLAGHRADPGGGAKRQRHAQGITKGIEAGFFRYLTKSINVANLTETPKLTLDFAEAQMRFLVSAGWQPFL
jgi:hypothetical protein